MDAFWDICQHLYAAGFVTTATVLMVAKAAADNTAIRRRMGGRPPD